VPETQPHITAGPEALAAVARRLGLKAGGLGWQLEGLCALGTKNVRLSLRSGDHGLAICLLPRSAPGAVARSSQLALTLEGSEAGPAVRKLLSALAARLGGMDLGGLLRLVAADPRSFREEIVPGQEATASGSPASGSPSGYSRRAGGISSRTRTSR